MSRAKATTDHPGDPDLEVARDVLATEAGALRALSAALGIGYAYLVIACLYATSLTLSLNVAGRSTAARGDASAARPTSPWRDLLDVLAYVWNTPRLLAAMWIAFLVNVAAFPFMTSLMPYVSKEIYHTGQAGVGYLVASFAGGALVGSIALSRYGRHIRPGRIRAIEIQEKSPGAPLAATSL